MEHWHEMALNGKAVSDMVLGILWGKIVFGNWKNTWNKVKLVVQKYKAIGH